MPNDERPPQDYWTHMKNKGMSDELAGWIFYHKMGGSRSKASASIKEITDGFLNKAIQEYHDYLNGNKEAYQTGYWACPECHKKFPSFEDREEHKKIHETHQYFNSSKPHRETMDQPDKLCDCKTIQEAEKILEAVKASPTTRYVVGLAFRMTDPAERKLALETAAKSIKEMEGSHQSDGDVLGQPPGSKDASKGAHAQPGGNMHEVEGFDMTSCVTQAIASGSSPEEARAKCQGKQETHAMVQEAVKPYLTKLTETLTEVKGIKEAVTALDTKFQETVKDKTKQPGSISILKTVGPGGAVRETTNPPEAVVQSKQINVDELKRDIVDRYEAMYENPPSN